MCTKSDDQLQIALQTMYDRVLVSDSAKASVPSPVYLSRFVGRNGLNSKSVMVADSKTVVVKGFTFRGLAPGKKIINSVVHMLFKRLDINVMEFHIKIFLQL